MLEIATLDRKDVPAALRLCGQANWNHVAADWERCLALNPEGCLGGFSGGELQATCTVLPFGAVGWVGTFLVDEALRGKGCGTQIFAALLAAARRQGFTCLGLDSSDAGRPIYLKHGFQMTGTAIELWTGPAAGSEDAPPETRPLRGSDWDALLAFDEACVKVSRARQLRMLAGEHGTSARVIADGGVVCAFGFSRPGRMSGAIGPVVARDAQAARHIVAGLMADRRRLDGDKPVALAILDQAEFKAALAAQGFRMRRCNIRMFQPAARAVLAGPSVFATTGLGMG